MPENNGSSLNNVSKYQQMWTADAQPLNTIFNGFSLFFHVFIV